MDALRELRSGFADELVSMVKEWVIHDNSMIRIKDQTKELQEKKNTIEEKIVQFVEDNDLIDINLQISDGSLSFSKKKVTLPQMSLTMNRVRDVVSNVLTTSDLKNTQPEKLVEDVMASMKAAISRGDESQPQYKMYVHRKFN